MMGEPTVGDTLDLVVNLFTGMTDKAGVLYWKHCNRVMLGLPDNAPRHALNAALLHDVLEDIQFTRDDLMHAGYSTETLSLVEQLTRRRGEHYADFIDRIIDPWAIQIKLSDLADNLSLARSRSLPEENRAKYMIARGRLLTRLEDKALSYVV